MNKYFPQINIDMGEKVKDHFDETKNANFTRKILDISLLSSPDPFNHKKENLSHTEMKKELFKNNEYVFIEPSDPMSSPASFEFEESFESNQEFEKSVDDEPAPIILAKKLNDQYKTKKIPSMLKLNRADQRMEEVKTKNLYEDVNCPVEMFSKNQCCVILTTLYSEHLELRFQNPLFPY